MLREEAKVGSLEMRDKVRGDEWVRRLTAGSDIMKEEREKGIGEWDQFKIPQ
jgi:hypothetical protein